MAKRERKVDAALLKVLNGIYLTTDCSNGVFEYAMLHWKQARIAESRPDLVEWSDDTLWVDGDGFTAWDSRGRERIGRGYRLTKAGYAAIAADRKRRGK